ncbi:hypothetical protein A0H81_03575 [Grifola frondosa]|uniref:DUF6593 domain-containing protein n=1 Tax=Grifola frondosa TaxID=5627 RepID=A0A1C7MJ91_GRIFR|nr:hypothetical protein A0H81_03575 [Grifola frondosa]
MAGGDIVLRFVYPANNANADWRTIQINQVIEGSDNPIEMYKFHHPATGLSTGVTSMERKNLVTQRWENAGHIEWLSDYNANVYFGIERVPMRELRRSKKASSKSRRFKAAGAEYKWKLAENGTDLICVSTRGKAVATWSQDTLVLRVAERAEGFLDRVVVTCILNLWARRMNFW